MNRRAFFTETIGTLIGLKLIEGVALPNIVVTNPEKQQAWKAILWADVDGKEMKINFDRQTYISASHYEYLVPVRTSRNAYVRFQDAGSLPTAGSQSYDICRFIKFDLDPINYEVHYRYLDGPKIWECKYAS